MYRSLARVGVRTVFLASLFMAAVVPSAFAAPGDFSGVRIVVGMTGTAERPGPGDPDGTGTAVFWFNRGLGQVCYELTVSDIAPATAAHIHVASVDFPGPVVIGLAAPTNGTSSGCADAERNLIKAITKSPENYYVNVHNVEFPAGAVRGQLG